MLRISRKREHSPLTGNSPILNSSLLFAARIDCVRAVTPKALISLNNLKLPNCQAESFRLIEMAGKERDVALFYKASLNLSGV
jgi:hypothetical protein